MRDCVQVIDPIHAAGIERLATHYDLVLPGAAPTDADRARMRAVVVRTTPFTALWMDGLPHLRLIAKHGSGTDNIDMPAATSRRILVANTPGGTNSTAVAEGAVTLMLAVLRRVRDMDALVRRNEFDQRWSIKLGDLTAGRLGLVGFGQIARGVARICGAGFGMTVSAYDPFVSAEDMTKAGVSKADDLLTLMGNDVISVHVGLNEKTRHLIGAREFAAMGPEAIIVNTSRGGLVDESALLRALQAGSIGGAGIDVFEREPPETDHPLFAMPNVVLSPHVAGVTNASMRGMALAVADLVDQVMAGERPATLLNPQALGES
jgi:D-3-phosphoglycerate dehydrogenase